MKFIKYITLALIGCIFASCSDKEVTYNFTPVDGNKAYMQLMYYAPVASNAANYMYKIDLNGQSYQNNGGSFLLPYNGVPSGGTNLFYTVDAGKVNIRMYLGKDLQFVYDQNVELKAGGHYNVFVYDLNKAPVILEVGTFLTFTSSETTGECGVKFYNMYFEDANTPFQDKIQLMVQNRDTKEYENVGTPIAFGECTDWNKLDILKKLNAITSGDENRYIALKRIDGKTGEDKGIMKYFNSKGVEIDYKDISKNMATGRSYRYILGGNRKVGSVGTGVYTWTAQ